MKTARDIITAFGGLVAFSEITGIVYPTVQSLQHRDKIDVKYWKLIVAHAAARSIEGVTIEALCEMALSKFPDVKVRKHKPKPVPVEA